MTSLLGGHVDCLSGGPNVSIPHIKAGTLRVLANWGEKRLASLMDTPILYLDAPEFQKFWDKDAERLIKAVRNIGKIQ